MGNGTSASQAGRLPANSNQTRSGKGQQVSTTFSPKQRQALQRRYQQYDPRGNQGIHLDVCLAMPEFVGNKLISILIHDYLNLQTGRLHLKEFLNFCNFLSPNTTPNDKKKALFESFNVYNSTGFTHDEIFRIYKTLFDHVISDDHILALTFEALSHPSLRVPGEITKEEFVKLIPDEEINEKLTVHFNIPPV